MHQFQNERVLERLHAGEILPRLDHHFRDTDFLAVRERFAQKHVRFVAAFLRLEVIRFVKIHGIDLIDVDEVLDIDRLSRLEIDALKIFVVQHDELPFFVFVTLHDFVPGNFAAILFRDALVVHRAQILRPKKAKL